MNRVTWSWPRGLTSSSAPPRAARTGVNFSVTFRLRRLDRTTLVRETHRRAAGRARYRDGDERRSQSLRCKTSGRRTPLVHCDCKHSASPLDVGNLDAVAARPLLPLIRDDDGARIEADIGQRATRADNFPRATPRGRVRNQLDRASALARAHRPRGEQRELDRLRLFGRALRAGRRPARGFVAEHCHAQNLDGRHAVAEQAVVEVSEAERVTELSLPLITQAQYLHLAERVDEI